MRSCPILLAMGIAGFLINRVVEAQSAAPQQKPSAAQTRVPRLADGRPDLQGVWNVATATLFSGRITFAGKPVLTDAEAQAYLKNLPSDG